VSRCPCKMWLVPVSQVSKWKAICRGPTMNFQVGCNCWEDYSTSQLLKSRANLLGVGVHALKGCPHANELLHAGLRSGKKGYVCVTGVHGVMEAQRDPEFKKILNRALLVVPDGMPTVWVGKLQGHSEMCRVFGPDLMLEVCRSSVSTGATHFLFGGKPGIAEQLRDNLGRWFPGIRVLGTFTPPFRPLHPEEWRQLERTVGRAGLDILWVGLSTPKQEHFMAEYINRLNCKLMIGVGAAFDMHTGQIKDAPKWMKNSGLQWANRMWQEPSRLCKRYLLNNSSFLYHLTRQLLGAGQYDLS
jgi:N-acetylglucosaminyldiphosphoundecaprenol N-acetyl-beta-D-mannosaminyltransferase